MGPRCPAAFPGGRVREIFGLAQRHGRIDPIPRATMPLSGKRADADAEIDMLLLRLTTRSLKRSRSGCRMAFKNAAAIGIT